MDILSTERLRLRTVETADIPFLVALWTDPEVTLHVGGPRDPEYLRREFAQDAARLAAEPYDLWTMSLRETGEPVGYAGLIPKTVGGAEHVELVYLVERARWGQGLASEIARALVDHAWSTLHLDTLIAIVTPENQGSCRVAEKAGLAWWTNEERGGVLKEIWRTQKS